MLYGAPRQSTLLATDLRSRARKATDRDRTRRTGDRVTVERRPTAPAGSHRSLLSVVLRHVRPSPAAHVPAR